MEDKILQKLQEKLSYNDYMFVHRYMKSLEKNFKIESFGDKKIKIVFCNEGDYIKLRYNFSYRKDKIFKVVNMKLVEK